MGVSLHRWPSHDEMVQEVVAAGGVTEWSRQHGRPARTVREHLQRHGLRHRVDEGLHAALANEVGEIREEAQRIKTQVSKAKTGKQKPTTEVRGDSAMFITPPAPDLGDLEGLIRERGLDPEDWEVERAKLNEWDALARGGEDPEVIKLRQLTVHLKRKVAISFIFPATDVAPRPAPAPALDPEAPRFVAFLPDPHCPYNDPELDKRLREFLHVKEPDRIVSLGDVCDFSSISRHRDNTAWMTSAQENIQAGFEWWAALREAAPDAEMDFIEGNHDFRIRGELLTRAERMYGIKPAQIPGAEEEHDALSMRRLLHLDRLRVNFVGPPLEGDNYFHGHLDLAPDLCARHGWLTGANSASGTLAKLGMSTFFGHTHHQRVHHKTLYKGAEPIGEIVGIECGTLALIRGGLGYAANPDWQQGFATATIWPDGTFTYDLARFDGKRLVWRDYRF